MKTDSALKKFLFVTDDWIGETHSVSRKVNQFIRDPENPLIQATPPHEHHLMAYGTVIQDKGLFRAWYQILNRDTRGVPAEFTTCVGYAESKDGVVWSKPALDINPYNQQNTNIVLTGNKTAALFAPTVVLNSSNRKIPSRYAMLFYDGMTVEDFGLLGSPFPMEPLVRGWTPTPGSGLFLAYSDDGTHWTKTRQPMIGGPNDSSAMMQLPNGSLLACFKTSVEADRHFRIIGASLSADGKSWTEPKVLLKPDHDDPLGTELYTLSAFNYFGNLLGFLTIYHNSRSDKSVSVQLARAENPDDPLGTWVRACGRHLMLAPTYGDGWDGGRVYPSSNPIFLNVDGQDRIYLYYSGANTRHDDRRYLESSIGRCYLPLDEFCGLEAGLLPGRVVTQPIKATTTTLRIHRRGANGEMSVEARLRSGEVVASTQATGEQSLSLKLPAAAVGRDITLAFRYRQCTLYSFWFDGAPVRTGDSYRGRRQKRTTNKSPARRSPANRRPGSRA